MPGNLKRDIVNRERYAAGTSFWRFFIITSSQILNSAATALTQAATGKLAVVACSLATDSTGLTGGTNFEISVSGETYGIDKPIVEAVSNLGASAQRCAPSATAADTTNDNHITVTQALPFVLEAGDSLQFGSSVADCTGSGKILVAVKFERLEENADVRSAL